MGYKNFTFGKLHNLLGHFMKLWCFFHHVIGNTGKLGNKIGDRPLRIYQGVKFINYLLAIVNKNGNFGNPVLGWLATGSFNIYYGVQNE